MVKNMKSAQKDHKQRYDEGCVVSKGDIVLTLLPGLQSKLDSAWEGPYEVLEVPSEFHVVIGVPGKSGSRGKGRRVHVYTCAISAG